LGRSYNESIIKSLLNGQNETITGDMGIMFLKASLESGISYAAGYPGAPTSNVMDLLSDSQTMVLNKYGIYFEPSLNEAAAATKLYLSINDKIRGFANWKVVGTNVASDVMSHVASSGVKGGALILIGEDEECISTTVKMKSQLYGEGFFLPVIDPIGEAENFIKLTRLGYELSEYCSAPVMFLFRSHTGNMWGTARTLDNSEPKISIKNKSKMFNPDLSRIPIPPDTQRHAIEKYEYRLPRAVEFIKENKMNRTYIGSEFNNIGIITHGGIFNQVFTTLIELGLASVTGKSKIDMYVLNVTYPLVPDEIIEFTNNKEKLFIIEQGTPNYIEREVKNLLYNTNNRIEIFGKKSVISGKGYIPDTEILITDTLINPISQFFIEQVNLNGHRKSLDQYIQYHEQQTKIAVEEIMSNLIPRSPSFCTGCPERPVFAAIKKSEEEQNERYIRLIDIGCYTMAKLPPFEMSDSCTGMGSSLNVAMGMTNLYEKQIVAVFGDGTLFHSGMVNIDNVIHNNLNKLYDQHGVQKGEANVLLFILLNYHTAMTGDQENPATLFDFHAKKDQRIGKNMRGEPVQRVNLERIFKNHGVAWIKTIDSYDIDLMKKSIKEAFSIPGLKIIVSDGECMLEKQRHQRKYKANLLSQNKRWVDKSVQVDPKLCSGCWPCTRYIGCPSENAIPSINPLKKGTIRQMDTTCVGCGVCSEITQKFGLCPSTYNYYTIFNPNFVEKISNKLSRAVIKLFQRI